ncbi:hypothetical protein KUTeg_010426 [Tegillarca granosa]|uniref:protein-tyrosine-phosphatase n=1 Tax=Tegillarca granosa TaxID=220873 RepID=A0ABQ9F6S1_TEGGR|nr:hypothetical protein KUTeg_010426 [Tegillarca granosa]
MDFHKCQFYNARNVAAIPFHCLAIYICKPHCYRINGFQIIESTDGKWENKQPCYKDQIEQNATDQPSIVTVEACKGPARYVRISNNLWFDEYGLILELCEVQIYGCSQNKYGDNCTSNCYCKQKGCFYENGTCFVPGCESGWRGTSCNQACSVNTFGANCTFTCHCYYGSCNRLTGVCDIPGCKAGWKGDNCSTPCMSNKFGYGCNSTCQCAEGGCDNTNGYCFTPGCKPGWKGNNCSIPCDSNQNEFGFSCKSTCHCLTGPCNRTTGDCVTPTCKDGWQGTSCSAPCMSNKFGYECNSTCHCKEGSCDNTDGKCFKPGCKPGWKGNSCSIECDYKTFGQDCKDTCNCVKGTCDTKTGICNIFGCKPGYQGDTCSVGRYHCSRIKQHVASSNSRGIGWWFRFYCGSSVDNNLCMSKKRGSKEHKDVDESQAKQDDSFDHVYHELGLPENTDYSVIQTDDVKETAFVNDFLTNTILRMDKIKDEITVKIKNETIQKQHKNIPLGPLYPQTAGMLPKNKKKNRNKNILPYDHSRVILDTSDHQNLDDDYINASYMNGLMKDSTYIATQGPMKNTVEDFWRMVWQTKSSVIVMLTDIIEEKQETSSQYWPVSSSVIGFHSYEIHLLEANMGSEFITRKLKVKNTKTGEVRKVCHLQFISWPNESGPHPYQLFLLHQKYVEMISANNSGPAIIHCSDGTDRTGVFIAFDALFECCYRNETIDICKLITDMRKYRMNMVATEELYVLLHKLYLEYLQFQENNITTSDLRTSIQEEGNKIDREYEMLITNLPEYDETFYREAKLKTNRGKNRNNFVLPVETYRLVLSKAGADHYINAVAIPDLIWYPADENKLVFGKLILTKTSESMAIPGTKEVNLNVLEKKKSDGKLIKLFQYLNWRHESATPRPQTSFLDLIHSDQYHFCFNIVREYLEKAQLYSDTE